MFTNFKINHELKNKKRKKETKHEKENKRKNEAEKTRKNGGQNQFGPAYTNEHQLGNSKFHRPVSFFVGISHARLTSHTESN